MTPDYDTTPADSQRPAHSNVPQGPPPPVGFEGEAAPQPAKRSSMTRVAIGALILVFACTGMFAAFGAGMLFQRDVVADDDSGNPSHMEVFENAWDVVEENYVEADAINEDRMLESAIEGMLTTLGDEGHTRFLTAAETERDRQDSRGVYFGVGVEVEQTDEGLAVIRTFPNSPAQEAGLQPGDIFVAVEGEDITAKDQEYVVSRIRGPEGTQIEVTILRPDTGEQFTYDLERREIQVSAVLWTMIDGNVALLKLDQFSSRSGDDLANALQEAQDQGAESVILDLRGNPGGYISEAVQVASMFVPEDATIFISETRDGGQEMHKATESQVHIGDMPLVVLINHGTASAAEIVSGAIKAAGTGTVIGETTVGTGTVLRQFELGDGSTIWLGIELWLTPDGQLIRGAGIEPEIPVSLTEDQRPFFPNPQDPDQPRLEDLNDAQLEYALDLLGVPVNAGAPAAADSLAAVG